ncbi:MAG: DUF1573 domain-containing protein [candidate division Zixibacteria bacterium]|nr:DUF1573 domain-containing protein [candidate division Zixibacteria bacterium]
MKKNRFLSSVLFLILLLLPVYLQAGTPKLELSETSWDWGRVPQNAFLYHKFWLKNTGTDTLRGLSVSVA